jgi:hypothetical protein
MWRGAMCSNDGRGTSSTSSHDAPDANDYAANMDMAEDEDMLAGEMEDIGHPGGNGIDCDMVEVADILLHLSIKQVGHLYLLSRYIF